MSTINWNCPGIFYIVRINQDCKIGTTRDLEARIKRLEANHNCFISISNIYFIDRFDHYWQAEFVEVMLRKRLNHWVVKDRLEYMRPELPFNDIITTYKQTRSFLESFKFVEQSEWMFHTDISRFKHFRDLYPKLKVSMSNYNSDSFKHSIEIYPLSKLET